VSFGVIEKPGMGEEVRVTVIATGFPATPPAEREAAIEALPPEDFFAPREPLAAGSSAAPASAATPPPVAEPEPEPAMAAAAGHTFDDELDVPAYLRQGKLLS
jgi:cell division GTPase FtsZ